MYLAKFKLSSIIAVHCSEDWFTIQFVQWAYVSDEAQESEIVIVKLLDP